MTDTADKVQLICSMCSRAYFATAGTNPGECVMCILARAEAESGLAAHERREVQRRALGTHLRTRIGARLLIWVIVVVIAGLVAAANTIQHARREAAERHQ